MPGVQTPHMDALAASGVYFNNAFVAYPVCSASKAALLTGRCNHVNGILNNTVNLHKPAAQLTAAQKTSPLYLNNRVRDGISACRKMSAAQAIALVIVLHTLPLAAKPPVIVAGWDSPTPAQFRQNVAAFEKWGLFDGTNIDPTRHLKDGTVSSAKNAFSREQWRWEEFAEALADLRAAKTTTCRETFLMLYANPGDVDWFDDAGWREVVDHWRLLARLAKQGGLRGLLYDAEPYTDPHAQFRYGAQAGRGAHTFAEYQAKARERGREVMRAVAEEFPEAWIFCYRLFSDMLPMLDTGDRARALEPGTYGLQPAFVDGWMDAQPPATLRIVEGTEDIGYRANSPAEYNAAFTVERLRLAEFLAPENRERFAAHLRIGQSLYLDAHINPPGNPWHIDRTNSTPAGRLAANLASALAASDGVVWLYGEQGRWWPGAGKSWPEKFPGVEDAILRAKDPAAFARNFFTRAAPRTNLLKNGSFTDASKSTAPDGWFTWQAAGSKGAIACADGRLAVTAASDAAIGLAVPTRPGTVLAARLRIRSAGHGQAALLLRWQTADSAWTAVKSDALFLPTGPPGADGWTTVTGVVEAPAGVGRIVVLATARGQLSPEDRCEFDDAELVEVRAPALLK